MVLFAVAAVAAASLIGDVRAAIARKDFLTGERLIEAYQAKRGVTPEMLEALSWLGRGALAEEQLDRADGYATRTMDLALKQLGQRPLDTEHRLPIAIGAAIEVHGQVLAARGQRSEAIAFLEAQLRRYGGTSIRTRIHKNINLLTLEGKPAPALDTSLWLGPVPATAGKPVLLFFWAHWCPDCKNMAPVLQRLIETFGSRGLVVLGPTQRYGYKARGEEATPAEETPYIDQIRQQFYPPSMGVFVSEEVFARYGASTTPTIVLVDAAGVVRLYHPGGMSYEELAPLIEKLTPARRAATGA